MGGGHTAAHQPRGYDCPSLCTLVPGGERGAAGKGGTLVCTRGGKGEPTAAAAVELLTCGETGGVCVPVPRSPVFKRRSRGSLCSLCPLEGSSKAPRNFRYGKLNPSVLPDILDPQDNKTVNKETKGEREERCVGRRDGSG